MPRCAACGQENPDGFRFCGACGATLADETPRREVRKTVTVVFTDISGSTALGERLDPETMRKTLGSYFEEIRRIIERHGGTIEKFIGDAAMAVFGIPVAQEDDALRAVRAVAEIRDRFAELAEERSTSLSFRTGVNTGQVVAGEGETLVTGDAVNVAARLEQAAAPGQILIGADTLALVRDGVTVREVAPLDLKGKREKVLAYELDSVDPGTSAIARHLDAPLVGRVREKNRLLAAFEDIVSERSCHLFTLLGPAGVGKSRLVAEFLSEVGDQADVMLSRCLHYGDDISYWPLVEILVAAGIEPSEVIGSSPAETQLAFRKLLEARAATRPQIVLFDDCQWAEPIFLDLIEHVADWSRDAPILLLCVARRELLDVREGWGGGKVNATTIMLEALSGQDCEQLLDHLAGGLDLSADLRRRILESAGGNPLFVEEMVQMVGDGEGDGEVVVPPTIQALLQARLDGLHAEERDVIGRGAVEGQVFHGRAVLELAPEPERAGVPAHLLSLIRKELIRSEPPQLADEEAFRFRHLLIRDAAYDSLPKETRSELHERFATWLEHRGGIVELDEIVGYHLEQAHRNRRELDPDDPRLKELAGRAAARLEAAARGAATRGDWSAVTGMLERAVALLPEGDPLRLEALIELAWPLNNLGRFDDAKAIAVELSGSADPRIRAYAGLVRELTEWSTGEHERDRSLATFDAAMAVFEELNDTRGMAWVERGRYMTAWAACRAEESAAAAGRAAASAETAGDHALASEMRRAVVSALYFGPAHIDAAIEAAEAMVAEAHAEGHRLLAAQVGGILGCALAVRGDPDRGRELVSALVEGARDAGLPVLAAATRMGLWFVAIAAGDLEAAEQAVRVGSEELDRLGDRAYYATQLLMLADVLVRRGSYEEPARLCPVIRETTAPDDLVNMVSVDVLEGYLLARGGDVEGGERLVRRALERAEGSDFYEMNAWARQLFAMTMELAGKHAEAADAARQALAIYDSKGDVAATSGARELVASLS